MKIEVNKKKYDLKFTFNSFKYLEDLDMGKMAEVENKPFKIIGFVKELLYGALNHSRKKEYCESIAEEVLEQYLEEGGSLPELLEGLMKELENSAFFKQLQK